MVDPEIFSRRLEALRDYLTKVKEFRKIKEHDFIAEPAIHHLAERYLHLMIECILDIGNHYLADRNLGIAETNREIFLLLKDTGELADDLADRLCEWASFRNVLVHEYIRINHRVSWEAIQSKLDAIELFYKWAVFPSQFKNSSLGSVESLMCMCPSRIIDV